MQGNEAFARGALEAGLSVVAGYPGTPASEIVENLARASKVRDIYVEWSVNEKVAMEVAAAASFAGLRSAAVMKQIGVNVASDFMLHLSESGTRAGMVLISCEDPGAPSQSWFSWGPVLYHSDRFLVRSWYRASEGMDIPMAFITVPLTIGIIFL